VTKTTYSHPRNWRIRLFVGGVAGIIGLAALIIAALKDDQILVASFFIAILVGIAIPEGWLISHIAREIAVTDLEIEGRPFLGRKVRLKWNEIDAADHFWVFSLDLGRFPTVYRLITRNRGTIAFTSKIDRFDELLGQIRSRTHVFEHLGEPPWWQRMIYRGWP
jgi:hypothetical protein